MYEAFIACRAVHFAAAMLLFGAATFRLYAVDRSDPATLLVFDAQLRFTLLVSAVVALLSALAMVPCVGGRMAGSPAAAFDGSTLSAVLLHTSFGRAWRWHLAIAALLVVACAIRRVGTPWRAALAALLLASLAGVGHAAADPRLWGIGHEANDAVHLLAGGIWLGGLVPLGALANQVRRSQDPAWLSLLRHALPRFSQMAYGAVALVALTGIVNTVLLVGSIGRLRETAYGRLLLVKLALVLLLLAVAVINRFVLVPWIRSDERPWSRTTALSWTIAIEQLLGLAIIGVVSLLGTLPPAAHMHMH
jgi:putative copper resistance protein D